MYRQLDIHMVALLSLWGRLGVRWGGRGQGALSIL